MGLNFSFFKTPRHRVFNYQPLYYDEQKEKMDERVTDADRERAKREGIDWKNDRYIPGKSIRGSIRNVNEKNRRHSMSPSTRRVVTIVSILILFVLAYFVADYFGFFISSLY